MACVIALPVDGEVGAVGQLVKVHDAERDGLKEPSQGKGTSGPHLTN